MFTVQQKISILQSIFWFNLTIWLLPLAWTFNTAPPPCMNPYVPQNTIWHASQKTRKDLFLLTILFFVNFLIIHRY